MVSIDALGKRLLQAISIPASIKVFGIPIGAAWTPEALDMIEVAAAVILGDRVVRRPRTDEQGRIFRLTIPVHCPELWNDVRPILQKVLWILGNDEITFNFVSSKKGDRCFRVEPNLVGLDYQCNLENVALFSGGLDSGAACYDFAHSQQPTAYLTHYVNGVHRIEDLLEAIYEIIGDHADKLHIRVYMRHYNLPQLSLRESSRRSRPFLFVSLAIAVASVLGAKRVFVCENGPLALNLKMLPSMIPTRHAHSDFLLGMQELAGSIFGQGITVSNPYELKTKGEMTLSFNKHPEIALKTVSCWNQQWAGTKTNRGKGHCGYCIPCLVRRAALEHANIQIPKRHFDMDMQKLLNHPKLAKSPRMLGPLRALLGFSQKILECSDWRDFIKKFPECIETQPTNEILAQDVWLKKVFKTMRRFSSEVENCFQPK